MPRAPSIPFGLLCAVMLLLFLTMILIIASVHAYCENRSLAGLFALVATALEIALIRKKAYSRPINWINLITAICGLFTIGFNVLFIVDASRSCATHW